jgi:hypothetical protein
VTAWPEPEEVFVHEVPGHHSAPRARAAAQQDAAVALVADLLQSHPVVVHLVNAPVVPALLEECDPDTVLVVGASHLDEGEHPGVRRVDEACALHAPGTLVVIEAADTPDTPDTEEGTSP